MSRVSRRNKIDSNKETLNIGTDNIAVKVYRTAVYARISVEDSEEERCGSSIDNQILIAKKYLEDKPYMKLISVWSDNGYSGMNFDRPGFVSLMEAVKKSEIDCIIVKDISRLGRNALRTFEYIENIFPFFGVRFIAINDNFDSTDTQNNNNMQLSLSIKGFINDLYVRDISKKVKVSLDIKRKNGEFIGNIAPYGYIKSPQDNHKLVIDEEAAQIVRRIFELRIEGNSYLKIAAVLNNEGIDSPSEHMRKKGINCKGSRNMWINTQIRSILVNPVYIGHMVQGRYSSQLFKAENTHEPIISNECWEAVRNKQALTQMYYNKNFGKHQKKLKPSENILKGKVICGECGFTMQRHVKYYASGERYFIYECRSKGSVGCKAKTVKENELFDVIFKALRAQMNMFADYRKTAETINNSKAFKTSSTSLLKKQKELESEKDKLVKRKAVLYDDYTDGHISRDDYILINNHYSSDIESIELKIHELAAQIEHRKNVVSADKPWIKELDIFRRRRKLSKDMADALVERVTIHSKSDIEIKFSFCDELERYIAEVQRLETEAEL